MAKVKTDKQKINAPYTKGSADIIAEAGSGKKKGGPLAVKSKTAKGKKLAFAVGGVVGARAMPAQANKGGAARGAVRAGAVKAFAKGGMAKGKKGC